MYSVLAALYMIAAAYAESDPVTYGSSVKLQVSSALQSSIAAITFYIIWFVA